MYFEHSGVEVAVWVPPVVAFCISFFTSMGGVSGAFLLMPFQMSFLGYTSPSVSATNQLFNVVAIPSGVCRYIKEKRMIWPLANIVVAGTLPGVIFGAFVRVLYLPNPKYFKIFVGIVLAYIGLRMVNDLWKKRKINKYSLTMAKENKKSPSRYSVNLLESSPLQIVFEFDGEIYSCSKVTIFIMSLIVGVIGGVYGIGGGAIVSPFFVSICGLPVYTVAGAALMGTLVTSFVGVIFYHILALFYTNMIISPDWSLGLLFGVGGICGMYCGARMQKYVSAFYIKLMLCIIVCLTSMNYVKLIFE
jgi:uncharacterized membrane protein YfcA